MNTTNVPLVKPSPRTVLTSLSTGLSALTPEVRKAAAYVLENPNDVGICSIREIADSAGVKPNTFVRLARSVGFEGYDDFRTPFREQIRRGFQEFPDRARWLQSLSKGGKLDGLYADMATSAIFNVEQSFAATNAAALKKAADAMIAARSTYVLGVGINHALAHNFAYLADMAVDNVRAIPRHGSVAADDLTRADKQDVLLCITFKPYRREVVDAVNTARLQGVTIIGISDSAASPIVVDSEHAFIVPTDSPQFFTSTTATMALLETLMAFVIADADAEVVANIEAFHNRRHALGIYFDDAE